MRVLYDEQGNGHNNLDLKIDYDPTYHTTTDTYYLPDFMQLDKDEDASATDVVVAYIQFIINSIQNLQQETFVPFGLYDEYIGGFLLSPHKMGMVLRLAYTLKYQGYNFSLGQLKECSITDLELQLEEKEWLMNPDFAISQLEYSIKRIRLIETLE